MSGPTLEEEFADGVFTELVDLEIQLDSDPLVYGPKRLNAKVAAARRMLARCERIFLDVSQRLYQFKRAHRAAATDLELGKKDLLTNDPEVRSGRNVADRDAAASMKLRVEVQKTADLDMGVKDLEAVLIVVKAKRGDLRDTQGRLRDQIRLCQEEIGLGGRWGSKSPRGIELEPGQGFADGADADDIDELIETVRTVSDGETHVSAEVDDSDDSEGEASIAAAAEEPEEPEESDEPPADPAIIPGSELVDEFGFLPHCVVCGEPQSRTPGGMVCPNGHGGAASVEKTNAVEGLGDEPEAEVVLPGTSSEEDVDGFLSDLAEEGPPSDQVRGKKKSRREIEEEDELDIDSILAKFN